MSLLLSPIDLRNLRVRNRAWVSPMCMYSCDPVGAPGVVHDWHLAHLGSFAVGGAGLVLTEAAAVSPEGRISPHDAGVWTDEQAAAWARVVSFVKGQGAAVGVQLAHAGRKASTHRPWSPQRGTVPVEEGGWTSVGPTDAPFGRYAAPRPLDEAGIAQVVADFAAATRRARHAGFDTVELHAAHGYLLHQFLSPLVNDRTDAWGGDLEGRARLLLQVVDAVRREWPDELPVLVRVSGSDWAPGGLEPHDLGVVGGWLRERGVDLVDVSSGGAVPEQQVVVEPGYQVPFAAEVRRRSGLPTGAVGLITEPKQAEDVLADGSADAVLLARALLRDPRWVQRAAVELGEPDAAAWPSQYLRARP